MEISIPALEYKLEHRFTIAAPKVYDVSPKRSLVGELGGGALRPHAIPGQPQRAQCVAR